MAARGGAGYPLKFDRILNFNDHNNVFMMYVVQHVVFVNYVVLVETLTTMDLAT